MLLRILATLLVWANIAFAATAVAQEPARIALLIGNRDYNPAVGPLTNTHKDVEIVGAALRQLGFDVTIEKDADYRKMDVAIRRHVSRLRAAGAGAIGFFYYSGHGVANPDTSVNYLIPVDFEHAETEEIWDISFEQSAIIDRLNRDAGRARHIIVFDACRDELSLTCAGQKTLGAAKAGWAANVLSGIARFLRELVQSAEQLTADQRWRRILAHAVRSWLGGRQLRPPPRLMAPA